MSSPFQRIFEAADCRTQTQLADFLGIRQSSISDAKRRQAIPPEWLVKLLRLKGINPDWILTGKGPQYLQPTEENEASLAQYGGARTLSQFSLQELVSEVVRRGMESFH